MVFGTPVQGRIHVAPVDGDVVFRRAIRRTRPVFRSFDLTVNHATQRCFECRHAAQLVGNRRDLVVARRLRDPAENPGQ